MTKDELREYMREYHKEYRRRNQYKINEYQREWHRKHRDYDKEYYQKTKERINAYYREHFRAAEEKLRSLGMKVFNPAKFEADPGKTWEDYMRKDIAELMRCKAIYLLKGWKKSRGARIEYTIAKELGYMVIKE